MSSDRKGLLLIPAAVLFLQCAVGPDGLGNKELLAAEPVIEQSAEPINLTEPDEPVDVDSPLFIMDALLQAYPDKVTALEIRDGEWSVVIDGTTHYWAGGRMLTAGAIKKTGDFSTYSFRPNPPTLPPLRVMNPEEIDRLNSRIERRETRQDARSPDFLNSLWGMEDFETAENTVIHLVFLGQRIRIHPDIKKPLESVESEIRAAAETDSSTALWLSELGGAGAYAWREIAGSANRSLHSYGIALDLTPADYKGKQAYWRWAADFYDEWWAIPYEERYAVPEPVVRAFEDNGFIWGGKWFLFDQIHFEYRPELLLLGELAYGPGNN